MQEVQQVLMDQFVRVVVDGVHVSTGRVDAVKPGQVFVRQWGKAWVDGQWVPLESRWWNNDQVWECH